MATAKKTKKEAQKKQKPRTGNPEIFIREYVATKNGSEAARRAGYTNRMSASRLLAKPEIRAKIEEQEKKMLARIENKTAITKEYVLKKLFEAIEANSKICFNPKKIDEKMAGLAPELTNASALNEALRMAMDILHMTDIAPEVQKGVGVLFTPSVMTQEEWDAQRVIDVEAHEKDEQPA